MDQRLANPIRPYNETRAVATSMTKLITALREIKT